VAYIYPAAPVGAIFLSTMRYQHAGQILRNQFHWRLEANQNTRPVNVVCDALDAEMNKLNGIFKKMQVIRESGCVLLDTAHQMIRPARYAGVGYAKNVAGDVLTIGISVTQLAAVLVRRSVNATRRGLSRIHMPIAADPGVIDNGVLSATTLTTMGEIGNAILNTTTLGDGMSVLPIVFNPGADPEYAYIQTFAVQNQVRVVRRRTVGLGE